MGQELIKVQGELRLAQDQITEKNTRLIRMEEELVDTQLLLRDTTDEKEAFQNEQKEILASKAKTDILVHELIEKISSLQEVNEKDQESYRTLQEEIKEKEKSFKK